MPNAHLLDGSGNYQVAGDDAATSGGDIGAVLPIYPTVWVRRRAADCRALVSFAQEWRVSQVKGVKAYNAAMAHTWTRSNVSFEPGWVCASSNRRDWLFAQFDRDVSSDGKELYSKLNKLSECEPAAPGVARSCLSRGAYVDSAAPSAARAGDRAVAPPPIRRPRLPGCAPTAIES